MEIYSYLIILILTPGFYIDKGNQTTYELEGNNDIDFYLYNFHVFFV